MSVCFFDADELGNVARALAPGASDYERQRFQSCCEALAEISKANAEAYNEAYSHHADHDHQEGHSADDIQAAAPAVTRMQIKRAAQTAQLLDYNLITNAGHWKGDDAAGRALVHILSAFVGKLGNRLPDEQRRPLETQPGDPISIMDMIARGLRTASRFDPQPGMCNDGAPF